MILCRSMTNLPLSRHVSAEIEITPDVYLTSGGAIAIWLSNELAPFLRQFVNIHRVWND